MKNRKSLLSMILVFVFTFYQAVAFATESTVISKQERTTDSAALVGISAIPGSALIITAQQKIFQKDVTPDTPQSFDGVTDVAISIDETVHNLTPSSDLIGLDFAPDEIDNTGKETHRVTMVIFNGTEGWYYNSTSNTNTARFDLNCLTGSAAVSRLKIACTHFLPIYADVSDTEHCRNSDYKNVNAFVVYINKSRLEGWSDAWSSAEKAAAFKAWLAALNNDGQPVKLVYEKQNPVVTQGVAKAIDAPDEEMTITSNCSSIVVKYKTEVKNQEGEATKLFSSTNNYRNFTLHATDQISIIGVDTTTIPHMIFGVNLDKGELYQAEGMSSGTLRWGTNKGLPPNIAASEEIRKIVRFGDYYYATAKDGTDGLWKIFKAAKTVNTNDAFEWTVAFDSFSSGTTFRLSTILNADDQYLYIGEYGDPAGGPTIYRTDGTALEISHAQIATARHIHAVTPDSYRPGWVWAAVGDNSAKDFILLSKDYGGSWQTIVTDPLWQGVQISFTEDYVWFASDTQGVGDVFVVDRNTLLIRQAAVNHHKNFAVPGNASGSYYEVAYMGCVDPDTGVYYCASNDNADSGTTVGLFFLNKVGGQINIMIPDITTDALGTYFPELFIVDGYVLVGNYYVKAFEY